ncbi:MAG: hypothetical protein ACRCZF_03795 [Gemmataceae bacterium]
MRCFVALILTALLSPAAFAQLVFVTDHRYDNNSSTAWLTGGNWDPGVPNVNNSRAILTDTTLTSIGIDMDGSTNNGTNNQAAGGVLIDGTRTASMSIGNSSTTQNGLLTLNGVAYNGFNSTVLANLTTANTTFTVQNTQGNGDRTMGVRLGASLNNGLAPAIMQTSTNGRLVVSSIISETAVATGITLKGSGQVTFGGINTYTGTTTIDGGSLRVSGQASGSGTGSGAVIVNTGTTLQGNGRISGAVTVNAGGTIRGGSTTAGEETASLNFTGTNTVTILGAAGVTGGKLLVDVNNTTGTANSKLNLAAGTGNLNLDLTAGRVQIQLSRDGSLPVNVPVSLTLATVASGSVIQRNGTAWDPMTNAFAPGDVHLTSASWNFSSISLTVVGNDLRLIYTPTPIPEPATILGGIAAVGGLWRLRRRFIRA